MLDDRDAALAEAGGELERLAAEFRRLAGLLGEARSTAVVAAEIVRTQQQVIDQERRTIAALQVTLARERGRRMRPKAQRGRDGAA